MSISDKVCKAITNLDYKKDSSDSFLIKSVVLNCLNQNRPIIFVQFTCSTVNPKFLYSSKNPEKYISLSPRGNNLQPDLTTLQKFYSQIQALAKVRIVIFIGNTDPFYIYSMEGKLYPKLTAEKLLVKYNERWSKYKKNLSKFISKSNPELKFELISWYDLEIQVKQSPGWNFRKQFQKILKNINKYFSSEDLDWELKKLKTQFGTDKYFYNIPCPPDKILKIWIKRKFSEYCLQGFWVKTLFPEAILLQNEKPSKLRTKMYQPLIEKILDSRLPVIYPYGVDNSGYQ